MHIHKILDQLAKKLKNLSDDELLKVEQGAFEICFKSEPKAVNLPRKTLLPNMSDIITKLENSNSRDHSFMILSESNLTVTELVELSKFLEIPCSKGEKKSG